MAEDFEVSAYGDFLRLSKALKHAGRGELRKELNKELRKAAKPLIKKSRSEALRRLPQRGGLAKQVAKEPQRVQVRTGRQTAGVRIVVGNKDGGARSANRGVIRHPVFGDRDWWVNQKVTPGWFDEPMLASAPQIRRDIRRTMDDFAERIVREVGGG